MKFESMSCHSYSAIVKSITWVMFVTSLTLQLTIRAVLQVLEKSKKVCLSLDNNGNG